MGKQREEVMAEAADDAWGSSVEEKHDHATQDDDGDPNPSSEHRLATTITRVPGDVVKSVEDDESEPELGV